MKKWLFIALISIMNTSFAGTVYRDRYIPSSVCMVDLNGTTINAGMILEVYSGNLEKTEYIGFKFDPKDSYQKINYIGWQVKMVNKENYTFKEESLEKAKQKKEEFLKKVKESCK